MFSNYFVGDEVINLIPHLASDNVLIPLHASGTVLHTEGINAVVKWDLPLYQGGPTTTRTSFARITRDTRVRSR